MDALTLSGTSRSHWLSRRVAALGASLPRGDSLPPETWRRRHRHVCLLLWLHVGGLGAFAAIRGATHILAEVALVALLAVGAGRQQWTKDTRAALGTAGLIGSSALLVHLSGGIIEMHFHFFVMVVVVSLYQSWFPFLLALGMVVLHHGLVGSLVPSAVYNHPGAVSNPWLWALVHGVFILGQSVACLVAWRVNEDALVRERDARGSLEKGHLELVEAQALANIGSWEWDLQAGTLVWSAQLYRILGVDAGVPLTVDIFTDRLHPDDRMSVEGQIATSVRSGRPLEYEARIVRADDGETRWISARGRATKGDDGAIARITGTVQDITARKLAQADLERLAMTDALTGLANRERFNTLLETTLADADPHWLVAVLLLDLDGFKDVNDGIGHHAGDIVLQEVSHRLTDIVRGADEVARLGGDEFVVLAKVRAVEDAVAVARNIRAVLEAPFEVEGIRVHVNASIGIVTGIAGDDHGEILLKKADVAMYRAKTLRCGWAVFEAAEDHIATDRLTLVNDLRATIADGLLDVAYQPIVDTSGRQACALEALARWNHPERGSIPPDKFIPLAEQADLIVPLTRLVLRKAAAACFAWRAAGHDVRVGVNLSIQVVESLQALQIVTEELAAAGLPPEHLFLEITESALATDASKVHEALSALRDLGVHLVIDDFGTGYSAMSYLKDLPVSELKIDRSFIVDITSDERNLSIVRSLIRLAHSLSLRVVAEGVETTPALEVLVGLRCDYVQGFGIARPMPDAEVADWLERHARPEGTRPSDDGPTTLLIVDDSPTVRARLAADASEAGWHVREVESAEDALTELARSIPDIIVLDHLLPGVSGVECIPRLREAGFDGPILLFTAFLTEAIPSVRVPLDVWPISKTNPDAVMELLASYRASVAAEAGAAHAGGSADHHVRRGDRSAA